MKLLGTSVALAVTGVAAASWAVPDFLDAFNARYDTSATKLNTCAVCHLAPTGLNPYGAALEFERTKKGADIQTAFTAVENHDSDGDGYANLEEINSRTWPGDRLDFPTVNVKTDNWSAVKRMYRARR